MWKRGKHILVSAFLFWSQSNSIKHLCFRGSINFILRALLGFEKKKKKERRKLSQKLSSLRPSFPSSVLNKSSVSFCCFFLIKLCNVWKPSNESQYNSIMEQRQEGDWGEKQGENGIISKLNETASFHFF